MSSPARGDTRPCVKAGCTGVMQYGREPSQNPSAVNTNSGTPGWVCSATPGHFTPSLEP